MTTPITDADRELLDLIECEVIYSDALAAIAAHRETAVAEYRKRIAKAARAIADEHTKHAETPMSGLERSCHYCKRAAMIGFAQQLEAEV